MRLISRAKWGARPPRGSNTRLNSTRGVKVHYTAAYRAGRGRRRSGRFAS